jgi:hypothetical protein
MEKQMKKPYLLFLLLITVGFVVWGLVRLIQEQGWRQATIGPKSRTLGETSTISTRPSSEASSPQDMELSALDLNDDPMAPKANGPAAGTNALEGQWRPLGEIFQSLNIQEDLVRATTLLDFDIQQEGLVSIEGSSTPLIKIELSDGRYFKFRKDLGELVYYKGATLEDVPLTLTHKDAVDVEEARKTAQSLLSALGYEYDLSIAPFNLRDIYNPGDLYGALWQFELFQTYNGYKTNGYISVMVSAYSGKILIMTRMPLIVPDNMEVRIDEEAALKAVTLFAESKGLRIGESVVTDKWIGPPNPTIWVDEVEKKRGPDISNPRPFYQVFAVDTTKNVDSSDYKDAYSYFFHVDCYTGEIIGGGGRESERISPYLALKFNQSENEESSLK